MPVLVFRFGRLVIARRALILRFLILTIFGGLFATVMPLGERVESFYAAAFIHPFALTGGGALFGLQDHGLSLQDGLIEPGEKGLVVAPGITADAVAGGGKKALMILIAVLLQQDHPCACFLLAGQQFAKSARSVIHAQLR